MYWVRRFQFCWFVNIRSTSNQKLRQSAFCNLHGNLLIQSKSERQSAFCNLHSYYWLTQRTRTNQIKIMMSCKLDELLESNQRLKEFRRKQVIDVTPRKKSVKSRTWKLALYLFKYHQWRQMSKDSICHRAISWFWWLKWHNMPEDLVPSEGKKHVKIIITYIHLL